MPERGGAVQSNSTAASGQSPPAARLLIRRLELDGHEQVARQPQRHGRQRLAQGDGRGPQVDFGLLPRSTGESASAMRVGHIQWSACH